MNAPVRVLLADDHALVRAGIRALLTALPAIEVVGEVADGREAVRAITSAQPHVVLMDIMMPGLNGLDATARIVKEFPAVRVVMLSMNANEEYVLQAMRAGARGYLLKNVEPTELAQAIAAVARGETYLTAAVSRHVISAYVQRTGAANSLERLTPRQREILQFVAEGYTTKEIASTLALSVKTIEMHRAQLMEALDIHDIAGLVRYAIRMGIVSSDTQ